METETTGDVEPRVEPDGDAMMPPARPLRPRSPGGSVCPPAPVPRVRWNMTGPVAHRCACVLARAVLARVERLIEERGRELVLAVARRVRERVAVVRARAHELAQPAAERLARGRELEQPDERAHARDRPVRAEGELEVGRAREPRVAARAARGRPGPAAALGAGARARAHAGMGRPGQRGVGLRRKCVWVTGIGSRSAPYCM